VPTQCLTLSWQDLQYLRNHQKTIVEGGRCAARCNEV
jgi:hypothetical protein